MKKEILPLEITGQFPRLVLDYVSGREDMKAFCDYSPDLKGLDERKEELRSKDFDRSILVQVLKDQHKRESLSARQEANLKSLEEGSGFTVCTGHQLCLMTGPAYFIYKICSIISLSKALTERWKGEERAIPVFWMATEDHDLDEIDHFTLFNKTVKWEHAYEGAAGRMPLKGINQVLNELEEIIGESEMSKEIIALMRKSYTEGKNLAQATHDLVNGMFKEKGLLILDADSPLLKRTIIPLAKKELEEGFVQKAMEPTRSAIEHRGEKVQAHARGINLFYLSEASRKRIEKEGEEFKEVDTSRTWKIAEILNEVQSHPERFSPNVLLRPIYQEALLPNLAYIGGPGEISYWLQLKKVFHTANMKMPVLLLRDSFLWSDTRSEEKLETLGFRLKDLFREEDELHKRYAMQHGAEEVDLIKEKESLIHHFDKLIEKSLLVDPGLAQFAKAEKQRLENAVDTLEKKMIRSEKKKHSEALARISQLKEKFLPDGALQERKENFIPVWMKIGMKGIDELIELSDPLQIGLKVIREQ